MACKQYKIFVVNCEIHLKAIGVSKELIFNGVNSITPSTITFSQICGNTQTFNFQDIVNPPFDSTLELLDFLNTALSGCTGAGCEFCLTEDWYDALLNANAPNAANPVATINDLAALDSHFIPVADLAEASTLIGLSRGDVIYSEYLDTGSNPFSTVITDITGGNTFPLARKTYYAYEAGGRVVSNESSPGIPIATNFTSGNNVPIPLRTRLVGVGLQQPLNMSGVLEDFTSFLQIDDPLQFGRNAGDPKFNYEFTATFSVRSSNSGSIYEFHFVQKTGAVVNVQIDSIRWRPDNANNVTTLTMTFQTNRAYNEKVGVYVERTTGGGVLTLERFSLTGKYVGQRGYY